MSTFEVRVYKLKIEPHNNADTLELAVVGDYRSIVRKGQFSTGELGVYIPEASIVPDWLIERLGLTGKLAGAQHNRVKATKLRGILSQGIIVPVTANANTTVGGHYVLLEDGDAFVYVFEGDDIAKELGITKYEPPIPVHMAGEVFNAHGYTVNYDIENIKKFPDILIDGEEVVMTEKLHGTWTCLGNHPMVGKVVTSKGLSGQGLAFKFNEANKDNLYLRTLFATERVTDTGTMDIIDTAIHYLGDSFYILGETFGKGVQDLWYGTDKPQFRVFDIYVGEPGKGMYLNYGQLETICQEFGIEMVPLVYRGPYSKEKLYEVTNGKETLSGKAANLREGVVVKPEIERRDDMIGRVQLKSVSEAYLLRKGDVTELT